MHTCYIINNILNRTAHEIATAAVPASLEPPTRPASLLLIDRAADLTTALLPRDALLAAVAEQLPRVHIPGMRGGWPTADVAVAVPRVVENPPEVNTVKEGLAPATPPLRPLVPGVLFSTTSVAQDIRTPTAVPSSRLVKLVEPSDPQGAQWWEFLVPRQGKDGPLFVRKWLREALRQVGYIKHACTGVCPLMVLSSGVVAAGDAFQARLCDCRGADNACRTAAETGGGGGPTGTRCRSRAQQRLAHVRTCFNDRHMYAQR